MEFYSDSMGYQWDIHIGYTLFGKRLEKTMERSTICDG